MASGICLCNRIFLFYGSECQHTPTLTALSRSFLFVYFLYATTYQIHAFQVLKSRRRVTSAGRQEALTSSFASIVFCIVLLFQLGFDMVRVLLLPGTDDRFYETTLVPFLSAVLIAGGGVNSFSLAQMFHAKLADPGIYNAENVLKWKIGINVCQAVLFLSSVCVAIFLRNNKVLFLIVAFWGVFGASLLIVAAIKTQKFLASSAAATSANTRPVAYQAYQKLGHFILYFSCWVGMLVLCGFSMTVFNINVHAPALLVHVSHFLVLHSVIQLTLCEIDYFLLPKKRTTFGRMVVWLLLGEGGERVQPVFQLSQQSSLMHAATRLQYGVQLIVQSRAQLQLPPPIIASPDRMPTQDWRGRSRQQ